MTEKATYRKLNDHSLSSSTYHKKDGTAIRQILKREGEVEVSEHQQKEQDHDGADGQDQDS